MNDRNGLGEKGTNPALESFQTSITTNHHQSQQLLAAIVESSTDAILTKDIHGQIMTWNRGAEKLFGYKADEIIGKPIAILIPPDRISEENSTLKKIQRGELVQHFETIRCHKDGSLFHVSLNESPIRNEAGAIIGASKIARDITGRHKAEEQQRLLLGEMQHRIKNVFALAESLISLCAQRADTPEELAQMVRARLHALSAAHSLTVPASEPDLQANLQSTSLFTLLQTLFAPYMGGINERVILEGEDFTLALKAITPLAIILNELVTNATKHGALKTPEGSILIKCNRADGLLNLEWQEKLPNAVAEVPTHIGFGTKLSDITSKAQLGGAIKRVWNAAGLYVNILMDPALVEE